MDEKEKISAFVGMGWSEETAILAIEANFRCEYCGRDLLASVDDYDSWQTDHIIPTSKGGLDKPENWAQCCKTCNFMKSTTVPEGDTREERIRSAARHIAKLRVRKLNEVAKIRAIMFGE